jgi:hypothetical protein
LYFDQNFKVVYGILAPMATAGVFNSSFQTWNITNLGAGAFATLKLQLFTTGTGERKIVARSISQSPIDPDSQPSGDLLINCNPTQDDEVVWIINAGQNSLQTGDRLDDIGVLNIEQIADYTLFPNPAGEVVFIKMSPPPSDRVTQTYPITTITLLNQLGKVEKIQEFSVAPSVGVTQNHPDTHPEVDAEIHEFSLQDVSNGVYFVKIETAGQRTVVKKLVVSRMY